MKLGLLYLQIIIITKLIGITDFYSKKSKKKKKNTFTAKITADRYVHVAVVPERGSPRVPDYVVGRNASFVVSHDLHCVI